MAVTPVSGIPCHEFVNGFIAVFQRHLVNNGLDVMKGSQMEHFPHLRSAANTAAYHPATSVMTAHQHLPKTISVSATHHADSQQVGSFANCDCP